jgi:hypothetical protein
MNSTSIVNNQPVYVAATNKYSNRNITLIDVDYVHRSGFGIQNKSQNWIIDCDQCEKTIMFHTMDELCLVLEEEAWISLLWKIASVNSNEPVDNSFHSMSNSNYKYCDVHLCGKCISDLQLFAPNHNPLVLHECKQYLPNIPSVLCNLILDYSNWSIDAVATIQNYLLLPPRKHKISQGRY